MDDGIHTGSDRVPPGQYTTEKWPVLTYGPVPEVAPEDWELRIFGRVEKEIRIPWADFQALSPLLVLAGGATLLMLQIAFLRSVSATAALAVLTGSLCKRSYSRRAVSQLSRNFSRSNSSCCIAKVCSICAVSSRTASSEQTIGKSDASISFR